jgi:hypothetical protein
MMALSVCDALGIFSVELWIFWNRQFCLEVKQENVIGGYLTEF